MISRFKFHFLQNKNFEEIWLEFLPVAASINIFSAFEGLVIVKPIEDRVVFIFVQLHLDWLHGLYA